MLDGAFHKFFFLFIYLEAMSSTNEIGSNATNMLPTYSGIGNQLNQAPKFVGCGIAKGQCIRHMSSYHARCMHHSPFTIHHSPYTLWPPDLLTFAGRSLDAFEMGEMGMESGRVVEWRM